LPERLESACFLFAEGRALEEVGAPVPGLTAAIRNFVCEDPKRGFSLSEDVTAFYPYAFGVVPPGDHRYDALFDRLFDPEQFWAPVPARARVGRREGRPFANVLVTEALANALKVYRVPNVSRRRFFDFLQRTVRSQFDGGDFSRPRIGEALDCETGAWKSAGEDVFRSTYIDLLIRHVGGLTPRPDAVLEFFPIVDAFPHFRFRNVRYRGSSLDFLWDRPDGGDAYGDDQEGFVVRRDGKVLFTLDRLGHVEWSERGGLKILE